MVFPLVMYGCESWTINKAEQWRIDAFELWCWREDSQESLGLQGDQTRQSILKDINFEYLLEGLMLKLKLQYFGHLILKDDSLEKTLILRKPEGKRRRGWQRMRWLGRITDLMDMNLSKLWDIMRNKGAWCAAIHGIIKSQTWLSNWTTTKHNELESVIHTHTHTHTHIYIKRDVVS